MESVRNSIGSLIRGPLLPITLTAFQNSWGVAVPEIKIPIS